MPTPSSKVRFCLKSVVDTGTEYDPPHATMFDQPDLGYARDIPSFTKTDGTRWKIASSIL